MHGQKKIKKALYLYQSPIFYLFNNDVFISDPTASRDTINHE